MDLCTEAIRLGRVLSGAHARRGRSPRDPGPDAAASRAPRGAGERGRLAGAARGSGPHPVDSRRRSARAAKRWRERPRCGDRAPYQLQAAIAGEQRGGSPAPTGIASCRSTTRSPRSRPRRWWSSTAPWPWPWPPAHRPGWRSSTRCHRACPAITSCIPRGRSCCAGWAAARRPPKPTAGRSSSRPARRSVRS